MAIAQGSSELNITVAVRDARHDARPAGAAPRVPARPHSPLADTEGRAGRSSRSSASGRSAASCRGRSHSRSATSRHELGLEIRCVAVADRSGMKVRGEGLRRGARSRPSRKQKDGRPLLLRAAVAFRRRGAAAAPREALGLCPPGARSSSTSPRTRPRRCCRRRSSSGFHVVLANKKPLAARAGRIRRADGHRAPAQGLRCATRRRSAPACPCSTRSRSCRRPATAWRSILGCLSGTLGYVMTALEDGARYSRRRARCVEARLHRARSRATTCPAPTSRARRSSSRARSGAARR